MQRFRRPRSASAIVRGAAALAALAALAGCAGGAGSCRAPCTSAVVRLGVVDRHLAVPIEAEGQLVEVMLDTGAFHTTMTEAAAATLGAKVVRDLGDPITLYSPLVLSGVGGDTNAELLTVHDLVFAGVHVRDQQLLAVPKLHFHDPHIGGLAGGDLLQNWDLDLDVGRGVLNLDLPQAGSPVPPWTGATTRVPFTRRHDTLIRVEVMLDGHRLEALVDTGAPTSLVQADTAAGREVAAGDLVGDVGGIAGRTTQVQVHHFADLSIGGLSFGPIVARVGSDVAPDVDMVIGLDVLRMARVYVAYNAGELLIDEGGS